MAVRTLLNYTKIHLTKDHGEDLVAEMLLVVARVVVIVIAVAIRISARLRLMRRAKPVRRPCPVAGPLGDVSIVGLFNPGGLRVLGTSNLVGNVWTASRVPYYFPRRIKNEDHGCAGQPPVPRRPNSAAASMGPMGPTNHPQGRARAVQVAAVRRGMLVSKAYRENRK